MARARARGQSRAKGPKRSARTPKYVYGFANGKAEGSSALRDLLGGKGCEIAEMTNLGIPVPPGFTITTQAWASYRTGGKKQPPGLWAQVLDGLARLEAAVGLKLGDPERPLLVSVRSGARASMPGMMDTVLNLGLNDKTVDGLARWTKNERFAWDCYRRFITIFGDVVLGMDRRTFDRLLDEAKSRTGARTDADVPAEALKGLVADAKQLVKDTTGQPFPQDPSEQLSLAINAVFDSWFAKKAVDYRRIKRLSDDWGTAVTVMAMVFGNLGDTSGTGVCFTRDPSTGEKRFFGEFLVNAQGEDVVAGIRTPEPVSALERRMPKVYGQLITFKDRLEKHYRDMQDIEFTIQEGRLFILQTRSGKRAAAAAVRIAVEMVKEGLIKKRADALLRVEPASLHQLLHPTVDPGATYTAIARGLPAAPGAASGKVVFDPEQAVEMALRDEKVILVRTETSPEDVAGMHAAQGILTSRGGLTSHAAVVARGMGKCCVVGAGDVVVDEEKRLFRAGRTVVREGQVITLNGSTGEVIVGTVPLVEPTLSREFKQLLGWAREVSTTRVRANADTPHDARQAIAFGAEGIGLCRTEHMFFDEDRIVAVREMILADSDARRQAALDKLLPMQRRDFEELFEIMRGLPVTIRLLDPPLHEFLPKTDAEIAEVAGAMGADPDRLRERAEALHEFNPMLGHRGCRLAITFPAIAEMQARAIFEAAAAVMASGGEPVRLEIMVPLVADRAELAFVKARIDAVAERVAAEGAQVPRYQVGTMIELPRAALTAGDIAEAAEFFSFGTNDLTQTTFGISRDDAASFLGAYMAEGILHHDPFASLDRDGVGALVRIACERGRARRPDLKLGICGEHGGDPASIAFCEEIGLDYVSCSPFRVPVARLAAAQATLKARKA